MVQAGRDLLRKTTVSVDMICAQGFGCSTVAWKEDFEGTGSVGHRPAHCPPSRRAGMGEGK